MSAPSSTPPNAPSYVVGVVHYQSPAALERCLASVAAQAVPPLALRVLDVDGGAASLAPRHAGADWVEVPNRGYAAAANALAGWAESLAADFLLLLNADVELEPGYAEELLVHTAGAADVALASGKLLRGDGRHLDSAGIVLPRNRRPRDPSAAAPTVVRKTSNVAMAILNPSPAIPILLDAGTTQLSNDKRPSGCGAIVSIRSVTQNPSVSASTMNALKPRAPGASPVRANTQ